MVVAERPILNVLDMPSVDEALELVIEDRSLDELSSLFRARWGALEGLGHRTHAAAYDLGLILDSARRRCPRGSWLEWVDEQGIHRRTAQRYIKFRELVGDRAGLDELEGAWGVVEAIAHLTPARADADDEDRPIFPVATPSDVELEVLDARALSPNQLRRWTGIGDLVVTSWPYGLDKHEHGYVDYAEYGPWLEDADRWVATLRQVLGPHGRVCLVLPFDTRLGGTPHPIAKDAIVAFERGGFVYQQHHLWPKSTKGQTSRSTARGSATPPRPTPNAPAAITGAEEILVFHAGEWSLGRVGEDSDLTAEEALLWTNAYWDDLPGESDQAYPCVFPDLLVERLVKLYSYPRKPDGSRSVVVDLNCGRGTVARVAMRLGRRYVGGDINPYAVALAQRNVQAAHAAAAEGV